MNESPETRPEQPWTDRAWRERLREFGTRHGIGPEHEELLVRAFTHRSLADVAPAGDNERLEFLGDSVLALVVNEHFFHAHPDYTEGQLTRLKTRFVSEPVLAQGASALGLGQLLAMAANDDAAGGRERPSTLSDIFEAFLATLYLTRGLDAARELVREWVIQRVDPTEVWDHKSRLQELLQEKRRLTPVYHTEAASGPAHERVFRSEARVGDEVLGTGSGRSKKVAEQAAAAAALARLEKAAKPRKKRVTKKPPAEPTSPPPTNPSANP